MRVLTCPFLFVAVVAGLFLACGSPGGPGPSPAHDAGIPDGGTPSDAPLGAWTFVPVPGSRCGSGAQAGFGINLAESEDDLFIFMQGGGACWNRGTCAPSFEQFGPLCEYGNLCLLNEAGGAQPTAVYLNHPAPLPPDGGGVFPHELRMLESSRALDREDPANPFRDATYVFIPYCTGDLHTGDTVATFQVRNEAFGPVTERRVHFAGAANMALFLEHLYATRPNVKRIWLTGASAGGYGATFHLQRVRERFPDAEVHLLADSAPFVDAPLHWTQFRDLWNMQLPSGCTGCADGGFPAVRSFLSARYPDSRQALLAFGEDKVIRWFFYAGAGLESFLTPPLNGYKTAMAELEQRYDASPSSRYFVLPTEEHVMWGGYGAVLPDGGHTAPRQSADGGTDLKAWIDAWATGDASWQSTK